MSLQETKALAASIAGSPLTFFVRNPRITFLTIIGCIAAGIYGISQMPVESSPEINIPIATVVTVYPGAAPNDIEKLVTDELEKELQNLDDVKQITSNSAEGVSSIVVEFIASADIDESINDLRDSVDNAKSRLPSGAEEPVVTQIRADDQPIVRFLLTGTAPLLTLKEHADIVEDQLETIRGVSKVEVSGLPPREMQIFINKDQLQGLGISITDVVGAIQQNHVDLPAGSVLLDDLYYQASIKGQFDSPEELANLAIAENNGIVVLLGDIAEIRESFASIDSEAKYYSVSTNKSGQTVALDVYKKVGEDLVTIVGEAKGLVANYSDASLPAELSIVTTNDFSDLVVKDISRLLNSAWQTVLIIAITLFLALGIRESLVAALSIPLLYLISFLGLALIGETFNFLTFFALILSLGIVVDTSIVVVEGMYEALENDKADAKTAAMASVATFAAPLISGSLTTIGAFLPLGLMTGIMGEYVKHIPITMNITLLSSLFTAIMLLPAIAVFVFRNKNKKKDGEHKESRPPLLSFAFVPLSTWYGNYITKLFSSVKLRVLWMLGITIAFLCVFILFAAGLVKFELFSASDSEFISVQVTLPEGTELEQTRRVTANVEELVLAIPELKEYTVIYGAGSSNKATINLTLVPLSQRDRASYTVSSGLRNQLPSIAGAEVEIQEQESGPPSGADIQIRLRSNDTDTLQQFTTTIETMVKDTNGTVDVGNDLEISPGEFHAVLKRDRMARFGVSASDIARTLRTAIFGDRSLTINRGGEETDIVVRLDFRNANCTENELIQLQERQEETTICRSTPNDIAEIQNLLIQTRQGAVPLSELVDITLEPAITTIRHFNTQRTVSVRANVAEGYLLNDVLTELEAKIKTLDLPSSIEYTFGGENEDTAESLASLAQATVLAALIIITILAYQFNSFRQVLLIMMTIPLAFMGVMYGLTILRIPLSFPGLIGLTALIGIVVNDAIVLVDRMNTNRAKGIELKKAVSLACTQRLQPVIITTLTTALGVIPLIFSGEIFRDLAIVVSVGITIATIFTLIVIPIMYVALEGERDREFIGKRAWKYWQERRKSKFSSTVRLYK